jgi:hypothetical protein
MTAARATGVLCLALCLTVGGSTTSGQSLAEVARRAGTRPERAGRTYTDADLKPVDEVVPAPAGSLPEPSDARGGDPGAAGPGAGASTRPAPAADPEQPAPARDKYTEQYWRAQSRDLRARLARAAADAASVAERLDAIDAGPQTPAALQERGVVASRLTRLRDSERNLQEQLSQLEARAREKNVPAAWLQ